MASSAPGISLDMIPAAPPPPGVIPNFTSPVTLSVPLIAVSTVAAVLSFLFLASRLYCAAKITRSVSHDDIATVVAFLFTLAYIGLILETRSFARHGWDLPLSDYTPSYFKILFTETILGALGLLFSKFGVLFLLHRLFSPKVWVRYAIYVGVAWAVVCNCTTVIVVCALCAPRSGEDWPSPSVLGRYKYLNEWAIVQASLNMTLDFYILYLPISIVWGLQMGTKRKVGVMAIFVTGFMACAASTAGLALKIKLLLISSSGLWNAYIVDMLNIVELSVSISVACMPTCASFFRHFFTQNSLMCSLRSRLSKARPSSSSPSDDSAGRESNNKDKNTKLNSLNVGKERLFTAEKTTNKDSSKKPRSEQEDGGRRRGYWKIKDMFSSRTGSSPARPPPQITRDDKDGVGDFAFDFSTSHHRPLEQVEEKKTRRASLELEGGERGPRFEVEAGEKKTPYDIV